MKHTLLLFPLLLLTLFSSAQMGERIEIGDPHSETAVLQADRTKSTFKIDGSLDEEAWKNADQYFEGFFTQSSPQNGEPASEPSIVKVLYTDYAIYVGAELIDKDPAGIQRELGLRDERNINADLFAVGFDTYYKRQNAFVFQVSASNVQSEFYLTFDDDDPNWNAIWKSKARITDTGWIVEMEIPFVSLRFPKAEIQTWGLNFMRRIQRFQEESYWHPVDPNINGIVNQFGTLNGLTNLKPPIRLQFIPYISGYMVHDEVNGWNQSVTGGMDFKYGINESFTLDVSLIPDFGQVRSDNLVLNLTPFEVRFDENRPFFTEGTEIFNRGEMFYSRRVGATAELITEEVGEHEDIISTPSEAPLLNATKLSGRTQSGLGIGFFNAITNHNYATVRDSLTGEERLVQADPLTNFNMIVLDKNLKNNSNIAFANTSVIRGDGGYDATVTGTDFSFFDKNNKFNVNGLVNVSQILSTQGGGAGTNSDVGYKYNLEVGKVSGNWQYSLERNVESHNFNPNDMGFLRAANEISHSAEIGYQVNEPVGIFNRFKLEISAQYTQLQFPREFEQAEIEFSGDATFKNFWSAGIGIGGRPVDRWDHFEARTGTRLTIKPSDYNVYTWMGTDSRKRFYMSVNTGFWTRPEWGSLDNWIGFEPRFRFTNRFSVNYDGNVNWRRNERGFTTKLYDANEKLQDIIMGQRDVFTATHILNGKYSFTDRMGLSLRVRHYWSKVAYETFFALDEDGYMQTTDYKGVSMDTGENLHDRNFNTFNIDMVYTWQFAPGSSMSIVWKNFILSDSGDPTQQYFENLSNILNDSGTNSLSVRILYFFDYSQVRRALR